MMSSTLTYPPEKKTGKLNDYQSLLSWVLNFHQLPVPESPKGWAYDPRDPLGIATVRDSRCDSSVPAVMRP